MQIERRCEKDGYEHYKKPKWRVSEGGTYFRFCPGKATWDEEIATLYHQCHTALHSGILPREGGLEAQDHLFTDTFPTFIELWKDRQYAHVWSDVAKFTNGVLTAIFGKK